MIAADLLQTHTSLPPVEPPTFDPLAEEGLFVEAELMEVRLDCSRSLLGVLVDLRSAIQFRSDENAAVLVARGVTKLHWTGEARALPRTCWTILDSELIDSERGFTLSMACHPDASLVVDAASFIYYRCNARDLPESGPDYSHNEATVVPSIVSWDSSINLLGAIDYRRGP